MSTTTVIRKARVHSGKKAALKKVTIAPGTSFRLVKEIVLRQNGNSLRFPQGSQGGVEGILRNPACKGAVLYKSRVIHPDNGLVGEGNIPPDYIVPIAARP